MPTLPDFAHQLLVSGIVVALCWTHSSLSLLAFFGPHSWELDPSVQLWSHHCWTGGKDHVPWLLAMLLLRQTLEAVAHPFCKGILLVQVQSGRTLGSCSVSFWLVSWSVYWCMGLFFSKSGTLHFPLLNMMRYLSAHFSSSLRPFWMAARPSGVSATPPSSLNLLRVLTIHPKAELQPFLLPSNIQGKYVSLLRWHVLLKDPVSVQCSIPVVWAITPHLCDPNEIVALQLHIHLKFLLVILRLACISLQALQMGTQSCWFPRRSVRAFGHISLNISSFVFLSVRWKAVE